MEAAVADIVSGVPLRSGVSETWLVNAPVQSPSAPGLLLSAAAIGCALQINFGQYNPLALLWLTAGLIACSLSIATRPRSLFAALDRAAPWMVGTALCVQFILLLTRSPGATGRLADGSALLPFRAGIFCAAALATGAACLRGRASRACLFAMLLLHAALGAWVLRAAPDPGVDVVMFQREGSEAILRGENPYAITFPNPYANPSRFYGPGVVTDGRLAFGYPYPPLSLLMSLPGHLLGDFRYAQLAAMTLAGALVALARPGRVATLAATVLLFTPRGFFVLEAGWTEPFAVLLLAITVFVACRRWQSLPVPLGLLIAVKQYLVLSLILAPLLPLGLRQRRAALVWKAIAVAAAVTLPLALWDLSAFVRSTLLLQFRQPFREDALSYLAWVYHATGWQLPAWVAFALVVPTLLLCMRYGPRSPAGYAAALALVYWVFFAFNKQAFCNYYHFVIGALCCAAGTSALPWNRREIPAVSA